MSLEKPRKTTSCIVSALALAVGLSGCASGPTQYQALELNAQEQSTLSAKPAYLQPLYKKLFQEGQRNDVLNRMEIGTAAFSRGDLEEARINFDIALGRIETVYANDPNAHKARSLWHEEGRKDFKGEPYERSMAYYYRGLLYLIDGDYGNARASFENAIMQDAFAEEDQNRSDMAMMMLLAGWAAQKMGSDHLAEQAYQELARFRPDFPIPSPEDNVLVIAETGKGPRKLADGVGHYELVFRPGKNFKEERVQISTGEQVFQPLLIEDVYWQATSRGGRPVDKIIEGKAQFREFNTEMGESLADLGVAASMYAPVMGSDAGDVGSALALLGVAQMALGANAKPRADTRYWSRLPDALHATSYRLEEGEALDVSQWAASYSDAKGQPVELASGVFHHFIDLDGNHLIWHSSRARK